MNVEPLARLALKLEIQRRDYELLRLKNRDNAYLQGYFGSIEKALGCVMISIGEVIEEMKEDV